MTVDLGHRLDRARALMAEDGLDALLLSVGADLPYFTGYEAPQLERLTMAVLPRSGPATLLVPRLEAPKVKPQPFFDIRPWEETDDPVAVATDLVGERRRLAIGEQTWATFLLRLQAALPDAEFVGAAPLTRELRMRKDPSELGALRDAGRVADQVAGQLAEVRFGGRTERDIAREVAARCVDAGHHVAWNPIVAAGPNGASPHHEPGDRVIAAGDAVVVDFGGRVGGYYADTTRTFHAGEPRSAVAEAYAVLQAAQQAAVDAVAPGVPAQDVDRAARAVIDGAGYGEFFVHRTGHGIGLEIHEHPYIVEGNDRPLEPGMTFSVEPGIYVPYEFGMRIEDIVAVTDDGVERLNDSSRDLVVVA